MATILSVETSTTVCSVALAKDGAVIFSRENYDGQSHSTLLGTYVKDVMDYAKTNCTKIDAVAVSCGPGSYTGLRIGVSFCKGLCYGLNIPLIAINTLKIMANKVVKNRGVETCDYFCPMIDARRMEVYCAIFNNEIKTEKETCAEIIDENSFSDLLNNKKIAFFGNGADKCKDTIKSPNAVFIDNIHPTATDMAELAEQAFIKNEFQDVAYFEPFYLKEFVATVAKNKVF